MKILVLLNYPPYGTERSWNGLRLAGSLARREGVEVRVFLFGDAVGCAVANQKVPDGYYHLDRMVTAVIRHGGEVAAAARAWTPAPSPAMPSSAARGARRWRR